MARQAAGDETDPARLAIALEKYVHQTIRQKDFATAFATAAEVAQSLQGDCTEHAVLLAALARASGLPARVVMGLVYAAGQQGFAFHMWTEVYLHDHWVPLDATLGQGGIGAAHLTLGHSNLKDGLASLLPVAQVLGQLKIAVLEIE
jgi:transglutaminase-like putative cysteine protease